MMLFLYPCVFNGYESRRLYLPNLETGSNIPRARQSWQQGVLTGAMRVKRWGYAR
jgi:hypothetical protein